MFLFAYKSLVQPEIYIVDSIENGRNRDDENQKSYKKSGLTDEKAEQCLSALLNLFETEKIYKNSNLTLRELSDISNISVHNISEVLNTKLNQSFYDFVNKYRVQEVQQKIMDGKSKYYNFLSLAFDAGFSSKSSFNTTFKKITGLTPTEFKNSIN